MHAAEELQGRIVRLFADRLNLDVPSGETDLFEAGALDSMAFVELLAQLEREFGIVVSLQDLEMDNFRTIERIAGFVAARRGSEGNGS
ncbi:MAG TPA: acyl carrier protein [Candidatus Polarisedimenticolia bacterium]|jgi:acyl carrier protein|nr:acyl carrier protein [Candidatus Polarisedimenticolia bacterium]